MTDNNNDNAARLFSMMKTKTGMAATQKLIADPRIQNLIDHTEMKEVILGAVTAAFVRAAKPGKLSDDLEKTFTGAILHVDEDIVREARTAIREYAALVEAQAYRPQ